MSSETVRSVITPHDQFLRAVFRLSKPYFIDIFQREYKWTRENVQTLLTDIELRFGQHEKKGNLSFKEIQQEVQATFEPYFLNTYLTHTTAGNISVVDGQQRLTTLLLILIKLYSILKQVEADTSYTEKTFSSKTLQSLIFETDDAGEATRFKIYNPNREAAFRSLVDGESIVPLDETQQRIVQNYRFISDYYDRFLKVSDQPERFDTAKLTYYITYLLDAVSIVEIKIEQKQNVAMIFEVVNDRGLKLKPYEILKGKLLGTLPEKQKEHANQIWMAIQNKYFKARLRNTTETQVDLDLFFRLFFRAKFADSESEYETFESDYHFQLYRNEKIRKYFEDFKNPSVLYGRITEDFQYFAEKYLWLRTTYAEEYLIYNKLLDQNQQYLLALAALDTNDPAADAKVRCVAQKFDQVHTVLRLLDLYDSNDFQRLIYPLVPAIKNKGIPEIRQAFDNALLRQIEEQQFLPAGQLAHVRDVFTEERFAAVRHHWPMFSKYVLMRIDRYLSKVLGDKPSFARATPQELEEGFNKSGRRRYGMHLEHIYAFNDANTAAFVNEQGEPDAQQFHAVRNLLGMVLLLKDSHNLSSGNDIYRDKIETYKQSNFIWNELLAGHIPEIDMRDVPEEMRNARIDPNESGIFPKEKIAERQRMVFHAIKRIWCDEMS